MDKRIERLLPAWQKRNISGYYCADKEEAIAKITSIIPSEASIGTSGSVTVDQLGLIKLLESRGNKVFNQYVKGMAREESLDIRRQGAQANFYLASANAVSETGEMVFLSAYGNRTAGIAYCKNVIIICGVNKLVPSLEEALKRAREYATPLNCRRLNWNTPCFKDGVCNRSTCLFSEYKRMCCQLLIIEAEATPGRMTVILVGEELGF